MRAGDREYGEDAVPAAWGVAARGRDADHTDPMAGVAAGARVVGVRNSMGGVGGMEVLARQARADGCVCFVDLWENS